MTNNKIKELLKINPIARKALLDNLFDKGISHRVLSVMNHIPREYFLDEKLIENAYDDRALPIGNGQTISQPYTVGFMTDLLDIKEGQKVLEIGTGSGYQALVLAMLGADVFTVERITFLFEKVLATFSDFNLKIHCINADGTLGLINYAPFDRIIVTAAAPKAPTTLLHQLNIDGIMVIPIGGQMGQTMTRIIRKHYDKFDYSEHDKFQFVPLIGKHAWNDLHLFNN